jgi:predicted nucleic acid-binding protein
VKVVVDASVALKWIFDEPGSDAAVALRGEDLIAPVLWLLEAANALWRRTRIGEITAQAAAEYFSELANAPVASLAIEPYLDRALELATEIDHPVYDCVYLAVALHHDTRAVTADQRFASVAGREGFTGRVQLLTA